MLNGGHYVLLIGADDEYIYLFDPYYCDISFGDGIDIIDNKSEGMNRRVKHQILNSSDLSDYAFGDNDKLYLTLLHLEVIYHDNK